MEVYGSAAVLFCVWKRVRNLVEACEESYRWIFQHGKRDEICHARLATNVHFRWQQQQQCGLRRLGGSSSEDGAVGSALSLCGRSHPDCSRWRCHRAAGETAPPEETGSDPAAVLSVSEQRNK